MTETECDIKVKILTNDAPYSKKALLALVIIFIAFVLAALAIFGNSVTSGIILGIVQGISEWLPISSKTQIIIASTYLIHLTFNQAYTFGLFMEIGTIFAAIIYFRKELYSLIKALIGGEIMTAGIFSSTWLFPQ